MYDEPYDNDYSVTHDQGRDYDEESEAWYGDVVQEHCVNPNGRCEDAPCCGCCD